MTELDAVAERFETHRAQLRGVAFRLLGSVAEADDAVQETGCWPPPPADPDQLAALLAVEDRLGSTDPYRQLGQLAHLILRQTT